MAAVSAVPTTALTPPQSPNANGYSWDVSAQQEEIRSGFAHHGSVNNVSTYDMHEKGAAGGEPLQRHQTAPNVHEMEKARHATHRDDQNVRLEDSLMDRQKPPRNSSSNDLSRRSAGDVNGKHMLEDSNSKWIHRDKLARIESEELQAAGIILPRSRAHSRPRRDISVDRANNYRHGGSVDGDSGHGSGSASASRGAFPDRGHGDRKLHDSGLPSWDLRTPEEIAEEAYFVSAGGAKGSRIPVAKLSPAPIPTEQMERDTLAPRKREDSPGAEDGSGLTFGKPRSRSSSGKADGSTTGTLGAPSLQRNSSRSTTDTSPRKATGGSSSRKTSTTRTPSQGRPKTRNGAKDANGSTSGSQTRPSTRSGERELSTGGAASKQPEGDPPWMISAYRPDPRLPPDQQLLPTVAKRLQQEKWEREGKFGNIYDKEFRPLTESGFLTPPEPSEKAAAAAAAAAEAAAEAGGGDKANGKAANGKANGKANEWPLKLEVRSPASPTGRAGSYSTIPKIQNQPSVSPVPSPRGTLKHTASDMAAHERPPLVAEDDDTAKGGCGCCILM